MIPTNHNRIPLLPAIPHPETEGSWLYGRIAQLIPASFRMISWTKNGHAWSHFLPAGDGKVYGYYGETRREFLSEAWHTDVIDQTRENMLRTLIHDCFHLGGRVTGSTMPETAAIILRPRSIITLGFLEAACYYPDPELEGHGQMEEALRLEADFPGVFALTESK